MFTVILSDKYVAFEGDKSPQLFRALLFDSVMTCLCLSKDKYRIKINTEIQKFLVPFPLLIKLFSEFKGMKHLLLFQTSFFFLSPEKFLLQFCHPALTFGGFTLLQALCISKSQRCETHPEISLPLFDLSVFTRSAERTGEALH